LIPEEGRHGQQGEQDGEEDGESEGGHMS
jgi:hypothetical protein